MRVKNPGHVHNIAPSDNSHKSHTSHKPAPRQDADESRTAYRTALAEREYAASMARFQINSRADATLSSRPSAARIKQLASDHAPIFFLHPKEKYLPADPDTFIKNSSLRRPVRQTSHRHPKPPKTLAERGEVSARSLRDVRSPKTFLDFTDKKDARLGNPATAPVLYQFEQGPPATMTYWLFYNFNNKALNRLPDQNHEGDWERVSVVYGHGLNREPTEVRYSAHDGGTSLPWREAPKDEAGRLLVNVALGSHAMSPYLANEPIKVPPVPNKISHIFDNFAVGGLRFDARAERRDGSSRLEDVTRQAWWGTEVSWGQPGNFPYPGGPSGPEPKVDSDEGKGAVEHSDKRARISLAEQLVEEALAHPFRSKEKILHTLHSLPKKLDLRDELSQDFVEVLARREKLDNYASTTAGREVLQAMARALEAGSTHPDEVDTYRKIQSALRPYHIHLENIRVDA